MGYLKIKIGLCPHQHCVTRTINRITAQIGKIDNFHRRKQIIQNFVRQGLTAMASEKEVKNALANVAKVYNALVDTKTDTLRAHPHVLDISKISQDAEKGRFSGVVRLPEKHNFASAKSHKHLIRYPDGKAFIASSNRNAVEEFANSIQLAYDYLEREKLNDPVEFNKRPITVSWLVNRDVAANRELGDELAESLAYYDQEYPQAATLYVKKEKRAAGSAPVVKHHKGRKVRFDEEGREMLSAAQRLQDDYNRAYRAIHLSDPNYLNEGNVLSDILSPRAKALASASRKSPKARNLSSPLSSGRSTPVGSPRLGRPQSPQASSSAGMGSPRSRPLGSPRSPRSTGLSRAPLGTAQPLGNSSDLI